MWSNQRDARRSPAAELCVQLVWLGGVLVAYFVGASFHPLAAVGVLAATAGFVLLLAKLSTGWRAVPSLFAALALQAPLLVGLGLYALGLPLGRRVWPHLCFWWHGTSLELIVAVLAVVMLSSPIGFMVRLERAGVDRLRRFARWTAPVAAVVSAVLVVLGTVRLTRYPTPDHYVESLPLHTTIPTPDTQRCTPIEDKRDPRHDPGWDRADWCATPDFEASPLSFHYHVQRSSNDPDYAFYSLHARTSGGNDRDLGVWFWGSEPPPEVRVWRDDTLDAWIVDRSRGQYRLLTSRGARWSLYLHQIRHRVAPPLGWTILAGAGLLLVLACLGASLALRDLAVGDTDARRAWLARRQGDLSLIALASAMCSSALLAAALFAGFLT